MNSQRNIKQKYKYVIYCDTSYFLTNTGRSLGPVSSSSESVYSSYSDDSSALPESSSTSST